MMDRSTFIRNWATDGAAIYAVESYSILDVRNCLLAQNQADGYGGGIAGGSQELRLTGCTLANNTADVLGAGLLLGGDTIIKNSILWGNMIDPSGDDVTDVYSQIEALRFAQVDYSTVQGWSGEFGGVGNLSGDPMFHDPQYSTASSGHLGDYHLKPGSPAINAGDPAFVPHPGESDLDGHARVLCGRVDIGAYESGIGDVDCNGFVDLEDFAAWPLCANGTSEYDQCIPLDFDNDGDNDLADFAAMQRLDWTP